MGDGGKEGKCTCILCLMTSFGTRIAEEAMLPTAAARGGTRGPGQVGRPLSTPLPNSYMPK